MTRSLTLLELSESFLLSSLCFLSLFAFLSLPVSEATYATKETDCVHNHGNGEGLDLGVGIVCEVTNDPIVALIYQVNKEAVEEEADDDQARTVVPAAFHYGIHLIDFYVFLEDY